MEIVEALIHNYAPIEAKDNQGRTSLHFASKYGHLKVVQVLVENVSKQLQVNDFTVKRIDIKAVIILLYCALYQIEFIFRISHYLLFQGANIDQIDDKLRTALSYSIEQGHFTVSKYLIREKANLHVADYQGRNCMHIAAKQLFLCFIK